MWWRLTNNKPFFYTCLSFGPNLGRAIKAQVRPKISLRADSNFGPGKLQAPSTQLTTLPMIHLRLYFKIIFGNCIGAQSVAGSSFWGCDSSVETRAIYAIAGLMDFDRRSFQKLKLDENVSVMDDSTKVEIISSAATNDMFLLAAMVQSSTEFLQS